MKLKDRPWSGAVVKVDGQQVYIDAGTNSGLTSGVELVALGQGRSCSTPSLARAWGRRPR